MKKFTIITLSVGILFLAGCKQITDQAAKIKSDTETAIKQASQQVEDTKKQAIDAKNKLDQKVQEGKNAMDAINKFTGS